MLRRIATFIFLLIFPLVFHATDLFAANAKLLVQNAYIFTMASGKKKPFNGYLVIAKDGTILSIGKGKPAREIIADKIVDAHGDWMIPGFVSAHSHLWQAAFRGLAADKTLSSWIDDLYTQKASKAQPKDFYWFTLLGALDHIEHGITTAYNFNYGGDDSQKPDNIFDENEFQAEQASGIRFIHGYKPDILKSNSDITIAETRLQKFIDVTRQRSSPRFLGLMISGMTGFSNTYQQAIMEATLMQKFNIGNHSHYLEPPETEKDETSKFKWFKDSGLLSSKLIFGHFIHANDAILQETAKANASMSWNPLSNGRLASGVADIPKYLRMGIRVGMGVDGAASADVSDPFENMRTGLYAIRDKYQDATIMSPYQVLWLHTMGSADVLGVKDKIGSLEQGKYADFLLINPSRLGAVLENPYANLVLVASEYDIDSVYIGGELQVANHKLLKHDINKLQTRVNRLVFYRYSGK